MINTLFSMHGIKYVISVDDCFALQKREELQAMIFSQMVSSLDPFDEFLSSSSQQEKLSKARLLIAMGADVTAIVSSILDGLTYEELTQCYALCSGSMSEYTSEKDGIIAFLDGLKSEGAINEYKTIGSTAEAQKFSPLTSGMNDGAILWLLDRNFNRIGESPEAGLSFAENLLKRDSEYPNYIYILSAMEPDSDKSEDDIEEEFDAIISTRCSSEVQSFIYYINKQRILSKKSERIAKSLSQGFKRKACYELFSLFSQCSIDASKSADERIKCVKQRTLNYLFTQKVLENGESFFDFAARFVQIFHEDAYNRILGSKHSAIAEKTSYYEELCSKLTDQAGNERQFTPILKQFREIELFNNHVNSQHCEITTGDVFEVNGVFYLLASQSCDTYLRKDGLRKLSHASLLEIVDNNDLKNAYTLSCFMEMEYPKVTFNSIRTISFDILDLCTLNDSGEASIDLDDSHFCEKTNDGFTHNYQARIRLIRDNLKKVVQHKTELEAFLNGAKDNAEPAKEAYKHLVTLDHEIKTYCLSGSVLTYPVKRVCRLQELMTIDVVEKYSSAASRIGHPFDYFRSNNS